MATGGSLLLLKKNFAEAQYMVVMGKLLGRGTLSDLEGAVQSFRLAAWQGQERAQYQLGLAYLNGTGVSKEKPWWRQRLEQALKRLQGRMSAYDKMAGERLLEQQPELAVDGLYTTPRFRYLQTMLNRLGFSAGDEDGLPAVNSFMRKNKLPRETRTLQLIEFLRGNYQ